MIFRPTQHGALTHTQLSQLSAMLDEQMAFRNEQINYLNAHPERFDTAAQREVRATMLQGAHVALVEIRSAQNRLADGSYGRCVRCHDRLPLERLEVLPYASMCQTCQRAVTH
jgi:DnaK suppressor protein